MELRYFQKGFNYSQDGPGNRLVYHLAGCNMRCPWCSNPEGMEVNAFCRTETTETMAAFILSARPMFFDGGGVTLTGGEVTLQFDAAEELLNRVHAQGVNTCIETNASHPRFRVLLPLLDTLIADFKHPDDATHQRWTGTGNALVKKNFRAASEYGYPSP